MFQYNNGLQIPNVMVLVMFIHCEQNRFVIVGPVTKVHILNVVYHSRCKPTDNQGNQHRGVYWGEFI